MTKMNVWIGFDPREQIAYQELDRSIRKYNRFVNIRPVLKPLLEQRRLYRREDPKASTEFSLTRFLVPKLNNYVGYALFMDCDMLVQCNIEKIMDEADLTKAVNCVKHDYTPKTDTKMDGRKQYAYPRKNWSSVMLFNCNHRFTRRLTPSYISEEATPADLHRMVWAEESIGELDPTWNCLSGYYDLDKPNIIHYTDGGPWLPEYTDCQYAQPWLDQHWEYKNYFTRFKADE